MPFTITVTNAGRAALVNAAKDGTNAVRIAAVGVSATALVASAATTALPGEIKQISTISGDAVAADTIHVTVRDESNGGYSVRSIALYLADGTLFAAYGQSDVLIEKSAQAMLLLALDVRFADIAAASLTFGDTNFLNPPATAEVQGVVELATDAEAAAGTDDRRAVTPKSLNFTLSARLSTWGSDIWRASNDGAGSGLDADLLDGQQGSYYANVPARLGYTPANRAGDTFTGRGNFAGNITGSSGIGTATAGLGEIEIKGNGSGAAMLTFHRPGSFAAYLGVDLDNQLKFGGWSLGAIAYTVWHAGNDGAGSGLDADLLDGQDSSYFANIPARLGYTPANCAGDVFTGLVTVQSAGLNAGLRLLNQSGGRDYRVIQKDAGIFAITDETAASERFTIQPNGTILINTGLAWHSANDGAGSGLDADLLDGRDSNFFAPNNSPAFSGTIATFADGRLLIQHDGSDAYVRPTNGSGSMWLGAGNNNIVQIMPSGLFRIAGYTAWHAGNDGAGSGLDADLLDGQDSSYYTNIIARLGYAPVNRAGDSISGNLRVNASNITGGGLILSDDGDIVDMNDGFCSMRFSSGVRIYTTNGGGSVAIELRQDGRIASNGSVVWHAGNDGAGSGVDADLLDGRQASDFVLQNDGSRFGSNGNGYWERRPNGVIEQWGTVSGPFSEGQVFITFPIPFTNADSIRLDGIAVNSSANNRFDITIQRVSRGTESGVLMVQYTAASTSINQIDGIDWRAVGI